MITHDEAVGMARKLYNERFLAMSLDPMGWTLCATKTGLALYKGVNGTVLVERVASLTSEGLCFHLRSALERATPKEWMGDHLPIMVNRKMVHQFDLGKVVSHTEQVELRVRTIELLDNEGRTLRLQLKEKRDGRACMGEGAHLVQVLSHQLRPMTWSPSYPEMMELLGEVRQFLRVKFDVV